MGLAIAATLTFVGSAGAQDWKTKYPEIVMAAAPVENATGFVDRYTPFINYLSRELGSKVTLRVVNDYAAVIEGQRAGNIHVAHYGPSSYVRAWSVTNAGVEVFSTFVSADGSDGLYPALYVRADSPPQAIQDLKGKNLCLVDPNSTTGNDGPRFSMSKIGIDAEKFFAKVVYAGSHENAIIAARQGTCDGAFSWWGSERDSMVLRMAKKGMVKPDEFRVIYKADIIPSAPFAYLSNMPSELKAAIRDAFLTIREKDRAAFDRLWDGQYLGFKAASHKDYEGSLELQRFVDQLRRRRS
ncbi:MAG TPA: phosphonate ABC transporter substrate-binding protein [Xanthobacteraceae bacterium]|nr:phosphonate ABC transporter substrate-binding protein [Xanthobacteraceae bacterium]